MNHKCSVCGEVHDLMYFHSKCHCEHMVGAIFEGKPIACCKVHSCGKFVARINQQSLNDTDNFIIITQRDGTQIFKSKCCNAYLEGILHKDDTAGVECENCGKLVAWCEERRK